MQCSCVQKAGNEVLYSQVREISSRSAIRTLDLCGYSLEVVDPAHLETIYRD